MRCGSGHGVRIAEDITWEREDDESAYVSLGQVAQWVKDREIALETSPSSNLQTGAFAQWGDEIVDHPFDLLFQLGFKVTVNTDNRLDERHLAQPASCSCSPRPSATAWMSCSSSS